MCEIFIRIVESDASVRVPVFVCMSSVCLSEFMWEWCVLVCLCMRDEYVAVIMFACVCGLSLCTFDCLRI